MRRVAHRLGPDTQPTPRFTLALLHGVRGDLRYAARLFAPRDLLRLLMWDSLRPVVVGLALGAIVAFLASRVVAAALFFGVSPHDPVAFAGAVAILLAAAMLAVLVPTRRAAAVDAASVLRRS